MWGIEDFEPYNRGALLQRLSAIAAFTEQRIGEAAEVLDQRESPHFAVLFQLPGVVRVAARPVVVPTRTEGLQVELRPFPCKLAVTPDGKIRLSDEASVVDCNATQFVGYLRYWGERAKYYQRYSQCFSASCFRDKIVITAAESWIDHRALRASDFEYNLAERVRKEVEYATRRYLKTYSSITLTNFYQRNDLYNFFVMPYPGRFAISTQPAPLAAAFLVNHLPISGEIDATLIENGLPFSLRRLSRFERHLFELHRMASAGHHSLVLLGSLSLIEWVLKINSPPANKKSDLYTLSHEVFENELGAEIISELDDLRRHRNAATHMREFSEFEGEKLHEVIDVEIDRIITGEVAARAVHLAWEIFRRSNSGKLKSSGIKQ